MTHQSPAAEFYSDPAMRVAQQMMMNGNGGVPSHAAVEAAGARTARRAVTAPVRRQPRQTQAVRPSRQARAALAGRPVQPLPTRYARKVAARRRRMIRRLGVAAPLGMIVMIALLFVTAPIAAVTLGLAATALILSTAR